MKLTAGALVALSFTVSAFAQTCPPINPAVDFVTNFNTACYAIPMPTTSGLYAYGDPDIFSSYSQMVYTTTAGYSLIWLGTFPPSTTTSATVYDSHEAVAWNQFTGKPSDITDVDILPLRAGMINPFVTRTLTLSQQWGITVGMGALPPTQNIAAGCSTAGTTLDQNFLDASEIHAGLTWLGYAGLPAGFPPHQTGFNKSGFLEWRDYNNRALTDPKYAPSAPPVVIVRQNSNGCAIPAATALAMGILYIGSSGSGPGMNGAQMTLHSDFDLIQPQPHYGTDPNSFFQWRSSYSYMTLDNPFARYLGVQMSASAVSGMIAKQQFLKIQLKLPTVSTLPFAADDGTEQVRYFSISFTSEGTTIFTFRRSDLHPDSNGMETLIVNLTPGVQPPAAVASGHYDYLDLTYWQQGPFTGVTIRELLPSPGFGCSTYAVPYQSSEYNNVGGYMGEYAPTMNKVTGAQIPTLPVYPALPSSCGLTPTAKM